MPFYTYKCRSCEIPVERFMKMADYLQPTEEPCPSCGKMEVQKLCDAPPLIDPTKLGRSKIDGDFRNILENVQKKTYKSDFNIR